MNNIKARLPQTSESMVNAIVFVMNLIKLLQVAEKYGYFSFAFLKAIKKWFKKLDNGFYKALFFKTDNVFSKWGALENQQTLNS